MTIEGRYDPDDWYREVRVNGRPLLPDRSQRLRNHSPTGFAWGYSGSGPAQLALAILLEALPEDRALRLYQAFKAEFIAPLPVHGSFAIEVDVGTWAAAKGRR